MNVQRLWLLLVWLLSTTAWGQETSFRFPDSPFHGLQMNLTIDGAVLNAGSDHRGSELVERRYSGRLPGPLTVRGSVTVGDRTGMSDATLRVKVFLDDRLVETFEKKLYESSVPVEFALTAPAGATRSAEFFVHISEGGENGVRVRGRLDANPAPVKNALQTLLQLYKQRIPKGLIMSGPETNARALFDADYEPYTCGGYQQQVLDFLDGLRFSDNAADRDLVSRFDYGPIEGSCGFHQAVVVYEKGSDWSANGTVLDPWPLQTPQSMTVGQWSTLYQMVQPSRAYAQQSSVNYPILGGAYRDPKTLGKTGDLSTAEKDFITSLQTLAPDHYLYQQRMMSPAARKRWVRGAMQRFKTKGHVFVECPVEAYLVDAQGRFTGLKGGTLAAQVPGCTVLVHPYSPSDLWTQLGYPPGSPLKLVLVGLDAGGPATVSVFEDGPPLRGVEYSISLARGQSRQLDLSQLGAPLGGVAAKPIPIPGKSLPEADKEIVLFKTSNSGEVLNGPRQAIWITFTRPVHLTQIQTYHWNSGRGAAPGKISLIERSSAKVVATWSAQGLEGQGAVKNAFWLVKPNLDVPAGTYRIAVSDHRSWSYNAQSANGGFMILRGWERDGGNQAKTLGSVLTVVENETWRGTWTRRPGTNLFDAVWRHPNGTEVRDVIELESLKDDQVVLYRRGNQGRYYGRIAPDGHSLQGHMSWDDGGSSWSASW